MTAKKTVQGTKAKVRTKSIDTILSNIEKALGNKGDSVIRKGVTIKYEDIPVISFGYPEVDEACGRGGIPLGKLVEIFGIESGGKSLLTLKLIASAQKQGFKCCLVDAEQSFDPKWAAQHGVIVEDLFIVDTPMSAERTLDYVDEICKSGGFNLVVVDSTAALIPQKELEGSIGDQDYALLARAMSKGCRKITASCAAAKCVCVFVNQLRDNMNSTGRGEKTTTPGGRALKFYSSLRIKVHPGAVTKITEGDKEKVVSRMSYVTFVKNKVAPPMGKCEIEIVFDKALLNPVVKACMAAKTYSIISKRSGTLRISKTLFENEKKNVDTEKATMVELADYLIKNDLFGKVLDAYIDEAENDESNDSIDPDILMLQADPSLIISPMEDGDVTVEKSEQEI